jgi:hypothetical protein
MIAHPLKVRELLDEIARGEVVLPEFQRAYVWKESQVVRLLDSLYHSYPSGQILLWDTAALPISRGLSGVQETSLAPAGRPKVVLDGQQRLTSLYKALSPQASHPVDVYFNLDTEQFQVFRKRMAGDPYWVAVRQVLNNQRHDLDLLREIGAAGGPGLEDPRCSAYLDRLQALRRLAEYRFPIEVFRTDDFDEVTELFVRINSGGTRLRKAELVLAQLALRLPGVISERFDEAVDRFEALGFALDPRFFVRALVAVSTGQSRFASLSKLWERSPEELSGLWDRTHEGLQRTVDFVRVRARFASSDWLPSLNALIPLVAFFERAPQLSRADEVGLLRWFYLALLRGRYSAGAESAMDEDLKAVRSPTPVISLLDNTVRAAGTEVAIDPEEFDDSDWRNPLFPITYAVARKRGAEDLFSGMPLSASAVGARSQVHVHPLFPRRLLQKAKVDRKRRDEIANLVFLAAPPDPNALTKPPELYLGPVADAHLQRLHAQCVPIDRELWKVERYTDFLAERRRLLADAVNELLDDPL